MGIGQRSYRALVAAGIALLLATIGTVVSTGRALAASDPAGTPFGALDEVVGIPGGIRVRGWAIDPDTTSSIYVWLTVDGVGRHLYADQDRPDVAAAHPGYGPAHGFASTREESPGQHTVCVTASNVGSGVHKSLGCRTVRVLSGSPFGHLDEVRPRSDGFDVRGWAIDPDTTRSIYVWLTVDGVGRHLLADANRPDVGAVYPGYGSRHGFAGTVGTAPGVHTICVTASNTDRGTHVSLGCRTIVVGTTGGPIGNLDGVRGVLGGVEVRGWAIDPDTMGPVYVWVTVDGVGRHVLADQNRPDVGAVYPAFGPGHGFSATLTAPAGPHTVCVTASNVGGGSHTLLGCRTATALGEGVIRGAVCYPSDQIPPMHAFFQETTSGRIWMQPIARNQRTYSVGLPAGSYRAFAYLIDTPTFGGAYTEAVECGLGAECTDHTLLTVDLGRGEDIGGIDLCDWYGGPDPGWLPPNPMR